MGADLLVIGGGVIGASVALRCADEGAAVVIVDRAVPATASLAAGAMLSVFSEVSASDGLVRQDLDVRERLAGRDGYSGWLLRICELSGHDVPISPGMFVIANPDGEDDAAEVDTIQAAAVRAGRRADRIAGRDVPGLNPSRRMPAFTALHIPDEASLDAAVLHAALGAALRAHPGVRVVDGGVERIELDGVGVKAHLDTGAAIDAARAVLAGGVGTSRVLAASSLDLGLPPLVSGRGVSLLVRSTAMFPTAVRTPNRGFACGLHVVPRADGVLYIGATNRLSTLPGDADLPTLAEIASLIDGAAHQFAGVLAGAGLVATRVGHRPVTLDRLPLVGTTMDERVLVATGTYRNGIVLAPRIGEMIAGELRTAGTLRGHPFDPRREVVGDALDAVVGRASRSLVASLEQPGGHLPFDREEDVRLFIAAALPALLGLDGARGAQRRAIAQRLLRQAPTEESIPLLFDLMTRER